MAIRITGSASGLDTDAMVQELVKAYDEKGKTYTKSRTKTEWKQEAWATLNTKIKSFYSKYASSMRFSDAYTQKATTCSDASKASIIASGSAVNGTQSLKINSLAKSAYLTGAELKKDEEGNAVTKDTTLAQLGVLKSGTSTITIHQGTKGEDSDYTGHKQFTIDANMTLADVAKLVGEAGYSANFDEGTGRFFISSKESGAANNFDIEGDAGILEGLGLAGKDAVKLAGEDAEIELNGATFHSSNNTFSINGLTITAKDVTTGTGVNIVTDTDYDSIYDKVKSFIKEYNSLINEIDKLYNADSAKKYEPLTDEEKDALTDTEVEKWEKKIKDSLLRKDSDLDAIGSAMRNAMLKGYDINGTNYSLSSFGISTLGYFNAPDNEKNAYHIDGNSDDTDTASNEDKLRAMIAGNTADTAEFFQKLVGGLYDAMNAIQSKSDNYTSFGNFYSDKKLSNEYVEQTKQIDKWEKYVADIEEKYYKQFTAMESSISSLQSQQSYISQLFA